MKPSSRIFLVDRGCDEFIEKYFKTFDTVRHFLINFYANEASLLWNGNCINYESLNSFFAQIPASYHVVDSYDAHPITNETFLVHVNGTVQYGETQKQFSQTFMLKQDSKTKIVTDHFRFLT
eukprot:NODE_230_length_13723_cov_0.393570.p8 type:complete len:122 gc:universal NODE_230_length_13723_cov_0.393570:13149-13514(+)